MPRLHRLHVLANEDETSVIVMTAGEDPHQVPTRHLAALRLLFLGTWTQCGGRFPPGATTSAETQLPFNT